MPPEANDPDAGMTAPIVRKPVPGLMASIGSIVAGVIGFSIPVVGTIASCVGIWLGIKGIRQGRVGNHRPSVICGIIGISVDGLGIVFLGMRGPVRVLPLTVRRYSALTHSGTHCSSMLTQQAESQMSEPIMIVMTMRRMIGLLEQQEQPASVRAAP